MIEHLPLIVSAFFVGALVGLSGVGAGAVMTPLLILFFSVPPVVAIATDLIFATLTKLVSAAIHSRRDSVDWIAARSIWKGSIPGVLIGILVVIYFGTQFDFLLTFFLSVVLIFTSISMLGGVKLGGASAAKSSFFGGAFIGFSVATTSVGAGALGMVLLRRQIGDENPRKLVGTDIIHAIPIALIAGLSYAASGLVNFPLLGVMLMGSIPGALAGSLFSNKLSPEHLRRVLAAVLMVAAISVLMKSFGVF
jgi:hypothetical protein